MKAHAPAVVGALLVALVLTAAARSDSARPSAPEWESAWATAVEAMPSLIPRDPASQRMAATGTDNRQADTNVDRAQRMRQQLERRIAQTSATTRGGARAASMTASVRKPLENKPKCEVARPYASGRVERPQGDSNSCRRLEKPVS